MNFREYYNRNSNLRMKALDFALHCVAGLFIVFVMQMHIYFMLLQWAPDLMLLYMWPHGMITKKWLPRHSIFLQEHKALHSPYTLITCFMLSALFVGFFHYASPMRLFVYANWTAHLGIDHFTHEEGDRR